MKNIVISLLILSLTLVSCSHNQDPRPIGKIESVKYIEGVNYKPAEGTLVGTTAGATTGALIGGMVGASAAIGISIATFGLIAPVVLPGFITSGALIGGATAGTAGYAYDLYKQGSGLYEYVVEIPSDPNSLVVRQYCKVPFGVDELVKVNFNKEKITLEKLDTN